MTIFFKPFLFIIFLIQATHSMDLADSNPNSTGCGSLVTSLKQGAARICDHVSYLLTPVENPTWTSIAYKASLGLTLSYTQNALEENLHQNTHLAYPAYGCQLLSAKFLVDAASETLSLFYSYVRTSKISEIANVPRNKYKILQMYPNLSKEGIYNVVAKDDKRRLLYISRMGQYLFNTVATASRIIYFIQQPNGPY